MTPITLEIAQNVSEDDYAVVLEPVRAAIAHTETYADYCAALQPFTRHQRLLMALDAYTQELDGGHVMFFGSSMGVMWQDVQEALQLLGDARFIRIYADALTLFDGAPSFDDQKRDAQLSAHENEAGDIEALEPLDEAFYEIDAELYPQMARFIREYAADFVYPR